jgi:hypothetical protein
MNSSYVNWYRFISSDYGQKSLYDFIKFNKSNLDYKVRVYDENNTSRYSEIIFYVGSSSSSNSNSNSDVSWFTVKELEMIQRIYTVWPQLIKQLKIEYPSFNWNSNWKNLSDNLYKNMRDVLDNKAWRKFTNYDKFFSDFMVWYNITINVIH